VWVTNLLLLMLMLLMLLLLLRLKIIELRKKQTNEKLQKKRKTVKNADDC
jgi:hypothetical protein